MIEYISSDVFQKEIFDFKTNETWVYDKDQPVILNFTAAWCGPCRMFAPILEEVANDYGDKIKIMKVDIDQFPELPAMFGVMSVPTTLFISKGQDPAIASGVMQKEIMQQAIEELLGIPRT